MATTNVYDSSLTPGISVSSSAFTVPQNATAAIRLVGVPKALFAARLDFSDGSPVVHDGKSCVLRCTHTCLILVQPGTYQFVVSNPDKDSIKIEVTA